MNYNTLNLLYISKIEKFIIIIDQYIASDDRNIEEPNEFTVNQCQPLICFNQTSRCVICEIFDGPTVLLILSLS